MLKVISVYTFISDAVSPLPIINNVFTQSTVSTIFISWTKSIVRRVLPQYEFELQYSYFGFDAWYSVLLPKQESNWMITDLPHSTKVYFMIRAVSAGLTGKEKSFTEKTKGLYFLMY